MTSTRPILDILSDYAKILDELADTEAIRSRNNPVADFAEWLVAKSLDLELAPKSSTGFDAIDTQGTRFEIKSRRLSAHNKSRQLSAIRGLKSRHFDELVGVLFDQNFHVQRAARMPWSIVNKLSTHREHTNAAVFHLRDSVWSHPGVIDITDELRATAARL